MSEYNEKEFLLKLDRIEKALLKIKDAITDLGSTILFIAAVLLVFLNPWVEK